MWTLDRPRPTRPPALALLCRLLEGGRCHARPTWTDNVRRAMTQGQEPGRSPGAGAGWAVLGTLIAGMAVWGGIGALLDWGLSTQAFLPIGVMVGGASSSYLAHIKD